VSTLKRTLALVVAVATIAAGVVADSSASRSSAPTAHAARCKYVKIGGKRRCLAPGKFCTRQWEKTYRRHGFTCSYLDRNDRYHLRRLKKKH
jgi:hypothetical protein